MKRGGNHSRRGIDIEDCIAFHGHLCPGLSLGFKAAQALLSALEVNQAEDEELVAVVETDACGADALQVMTGCTFGKGNLIFKDYGKHAYTLASRKSGRAFRACPKPGTFNPGAEHTTLFQKIQADQATGEEKERFKTLQRQTSDRISGMQAEEIFTIKEVSLELPAKARIIMSEVCSTCGEPVRADYLTVTGGMKRCRQCSSQGHL